MHPPVDRDVIDFDASLSQEFLHVAIRQAIAEVPANRQRDHLVGAEYSAVPVTSAYGLAEQTMKSVTAAKKQLLQ